MSAFCRCSGSLPRQCVHSAVLCFSSVMLLLHPTHDKRTLAKAMMPPALAVGVGTAMVLVWSPLSNSLSALSLPMMGSKMRSSGLARKCSR